MRHFAALVVLALVALFTTPALPSPKVADVKALESMTVALVRPTEDGMVPGCSAVWIGPDLIATAEHCVDDTEEGETVFYATRTDALDANGREREEIHARTAEVLKRDAAHDLAILRAKGAVPAHESATIAKSYKQGDRVRTMGHPLFQWFSYSSGDIAAIREMPSEDDRSDEYNMWIQTTAPVSPGNSGGGLFDARGDLIGIGHAIIPPSGRNASNLGFFIAAKYLPALLPR